MRKQGSPVLTPARVAVGVLVLLIAGLWVFRIALLESVLHARLASMGVPAASFEATSLTPWHINIQNVKLTGGNRLRQGKIEIDWPNLFSPEVTRITLAGLELDLSVSPEDLNWYSLIPGLAGKATNEPEHGAKASTDFPEIHIRDATARFMAPDATIFTELVASTISFVPVRDGVGKGIGGVTGQKIEVAADLTLPSLRVGGWEVTGGTFTAAGQIERRDGHLYYRPEGCDRVSLTELKAGNISVSGALAACLKIVNQDQVIEIDPNGRVTTDMVIGLEATRVDLVVSTLPSIPVELGKSILTLQVSTGPDNSPIVRTSLSKLDLKLPTAGISVDGVNVSAVKEAEEGTSQVWSITLGARQLRYLDAVPILAPLTIEGKGRWTPETFTVDARFQQSSPGLDGMFQLNRDNETGEGEVKFDISSLEFREGSLEFGDVSPYISQFVTHLTGDLHASGKLLFNDAWATPLQITGTGKDLVARINSSWLQSTEERLLVNIGASRFDISLPPLSPERGWATLNVADAGILLDDVILGGSSGTINFLSLNPLTCPRRLEPATTKTGVEDDVVATIGTCLYGVFPTDELDSFLAEM